MLRQVNRKSGLQLRPARIPSSERHKDRFRITLRDTPCLRPPAAEDDPKWPMDQAKSWSGEYTLHRSMNGGPTGPFAPRFPPADESIHFANSFLCGGRKDQIGTTRHGKTVCLSRSAAVGQRSPRVGRGRTRSIAPTPKTWQKMCAADTRFAIEELQRFWLPPRWVTSRRMTQRSCRRGLKELLTAENLPVAMVRCSAWFVVFAVNSASLHHLVFQP